MKQTDIDKVEVELENQFNTMIKAIESYLSNHEDGILYANTELHDEIIKRLSTDVNSRVRKSSCRIPYAVPRVKSTKKEIFCDIKTNTLFYLLCIAIVDHGYDYTTKSFLPLLPAASKKLIQGLFNWSIKDVCSSGSYGGYSALDNTFRLLTNADPIQYFNHFTKVTNNFYIQSSPVIELIKAEPRDNLEITLVLSDEFYIFQADQIDHPPLFYIGKVADKTEIVIGDFEMQLTHDGIKLLEMELYGYSKYSYVDYSVFKKKATEDFYKRNAEKKSKIK